MVFFYNLIWEYTVEPAGQATDENMAHAHRMLDTYDYEYTHSGCVTFIVFPLL
jgi:hypothetical protein